MRLNQATLQSLLSETKKQVLDTLFPLRCLGCRTKKYWLCPVCQGRLLIHTEQQCPLCLKHITPAGQICFDCLPRVPALDGIFVAASYHEPLLTHIIHAYKYRFIPDLAQPLGLLLKNALERSSLPLPDAFIPVPLHPRRLRFRGFNQSELLARELSEALTPGLAIPLLTDVLLRIRYTKPQMKTDSREERLANLKNAFAVTIGKENEIRGKHIWLIDDVATTGTTLEECASRLKQHGARTIFGIVLAR
ncbi:MAG: ComF family protein [Candidatus Moranbacteria bacterium]|nr:ComF family protein [Candidatus Moranbacteria bacterium]